MCRTEERKEPMLTELSVEQLSDFIFKEQSRQLEYYLALLQHTREMQETLIKQMKEEPAIGSELLARDVFYK